MTEVGAQNTESLLSVVRDQVEYLLAMLARPVVQQQLLVIILIIALSALLQEVIRRRRRLRNTKPLQFGSAGQPRRSRLTSAAYYLVAPIFAQILLELAIQLFTLRNQPGGLLNEVQILVWLWLAYRTIVMLLYIFFGEASQAYHHWIVAPVFIIFGIVQALSILPGSVTLSNATISIGSMSIYFSSLLTALAVLYLFIIAGWVTREVMMRWLPSRISAEPGVIDSVATITRYALLAVGTILSLSLLGLDFTSLAIIAGGLSVGIGIGLQDFVANFVSGLVLLFEQTLKPGDIVEIENRLCRVKQISLRATTVSTLTNHDLIFPNSIFTSQMVTNLTKSDRVVRVLVPFSVSYGSSPDYVREIAAETALQHPLAMAEPPPFVAFLGYGESSLDFNLSLSINEPEKSGRVRSDLYYMIWDAFEDKGITIPYPQRVLHMGEGWEKISATSQPPTP